MKKKHKKVEDCPTVDENGNVLPYFKTMAEMPVNLLHVSMKPYFVCPVCGKTKKLLNNREDMIKKLREDFGDDINPDDCDVICDECYQNTESGAW